MRATDLTHLNHLKTKTNGSPNLRIGVIDGPVFPGHGDLEGARVTSIGSSIDISCRNISSRECLHGTFVLGMLAAHRTTQFPGICPDCNFLVRPILCEETDSYSCPQITPNSLAEAIAECVEAGARIINMSVGIPGSSVREYPTLKEAYDLAARKGVLLIAAAGNQGRIGQIPLIQHPWVIPVAACDDAGRLLAQSNTSTSVARNGLMAPGYEVPGILAMGKHTTWTGTSMAAPTVTGVAALLWSLYPEASASRIRTALLAAAGRRRGIIPPLLNAQKSEQFLRSKS